MRNLAVLAALALALAGCGELPRPFQPEFKSEATNPLLLPPDRAGVVVEPIAGLPYGAAFAERLAESLREEGIVAMTGHGNARSMRLSGEAAAISGGWDVHVALNDARGNALGMLVWSLPPETPPPQMAALARAVALVLYPDGPVPLARKPSVIVGDVTGVPGEGGRALARALEFNLKRADVKLADTPAQATHIINALVTIAPARGTPPHETRKVDVRWLVLRADRQEVGEVRQANDVPLRDLDRNWSEIAYAVADAAVEGLTNLLSRAPSASR